VKESKAASIRYLGAMSYGWDNRWPVDWPIKLTGGLSGLTEEPESDGLPEGFRAERP